MTRQEKAVIAAAVAWWESKRPVGWTTAAHLRSPLVNTCTDAEASLAVVVARLVTGRRRSKP